MQSMSENEPMLDERLLLEAAREARKKAYAPYSKFLVGAAILDDQGKLHKGCNVENAAYPQGTCAEAGAIAAMILAEGKQIKAIAVVGESPDPVTPCFLPENENRFTPLLPPGLAAIGARLVSCFRSSPLFHCASSTKRTHRKTRMRSQIQQIPPNLSFLGGC